ncbi:heme biosynthesis protein HemY [Cellulomonas rhizosphaerae]|uniref:Heme biosynthesis protein HemY n=1 Tax=Cellulomonas rhizosphaerae TaxID=2293719 RepID=A0A413RMH3_9CELL|nr:heme biosynthesis protein HemY [Cellulomonas rhizosphaerae]RHA41978.1 heme biosynthesis protein HemY [Cellulomonas rhizosphaerae]
MDRETRTDAPTPDPVAQYRALPEPVRLADTVPLVETVEARDPEMGRDTDRDLMLRHLA